MVTFDFVIWTLWRPKCHSFYEYMDQNVIFVKKNLLKRYFKNKVLKRHNIKTKLSNHLLPFDSTSLVSVKTIQFLWDWQSSNNKVDIFKQSLFRNSYVSYLLYSRKRLQRTIYSLNASLVIVLSNFLDVALDKIHKKKYYISQIEILKSKSQMIWFLVLEN